MANPVLVEILRGEIVESAHRGAISVRDARGGTVLAIGDVTQPVFPRSAVKAIQALPLVESGAADRFGFGDRELAIACASHGGEPAHAELSASMLERAGLGEPALECGSHWPSYHEATIRLAGEGRRPNQLHNNCSGKHAGFVCTCVHAGVDPKGYVGPDHWMQQEIRAAMIDVTGAAHGPENRAIDGCSIPTFAIPIESLALGFARMATGLGLAPARAAAARRLFSACMAEPYYVAGNGRADTALMQLAPGRIFVKTGAEGVYCAALPELGLGIALKCDDGASRGAEAIVSAVLTRLLAADEGLSASLAGLARPAIPSRKGVAVGETRITAALA